MASVKTNNNSNQHPVHRVVAFSIAGPYTLQIGFDDGSTQVIDFLPLLHGELYGPLRDADVFNAVRIDPEAQTLVWPNGADFDPATLHDWPQHAERMEAMAQRWATHA